MRGLVLGDFRYDATDEDDIAEGFDEIEEGLRNLFNEVIAPHVIERYGKNDTVALDTAFNDWTDSLCKEGQIAQEVYDRVTRTDD